MLYPMLFKPVYRDYIWGGTSIAGAFSRENTPTPCAESWEMSAHPDGMSIVENGEYAGKPLQELCEELGQDLLGSFCEGKVFPLLIKLIDAKERLSVQVHPNDESAKRYGGEAKTEMWYILDAKEDGKVCAGLKQGTGPRKFKDAIHDKVVTSLLTEVPVVKDKAIFIPGGLVHAICEGCMIYEVQQNSNTTYRVYDWDRVGPDGKGRPLHIREAMEVIDWHAPNIGLLNAIPMSANSKANKRERILRCDYFTMERYTLAEAENFENDGTSFISLFAQNSAIVVKVDGVDYPVPAGRSCLIPAGIKNFTVEGAEPSARILVVHI
jgi:mannose-6-phosphate isomerase